MSLLSFLNPFSSANSIPHQDQRTVQTRAAYDQQLQQLASLAKTGGTLIPIQQAFQQLSNQFSGPDIGGGRAVSPQEIQATLSHIYGSAAPQPGYSQTAPQETLGMAGSSNSGGAAGAPAVDYMPQAQTARSPLDALFGQLYGGLNTQVTQGQQNIQKQYGSQLQNEANQYNTGLDQNAANYTGRGTYDSSYRANNQDQLTSGFNTDKQAILDAQNQALTGLGQWYSGQLAQFQPQQQQLQGANAYNSQSGVDYLNGLGSQLRQSIAGLGSDQSYQNLVNSIAPVNTSNLQNQLDQVAKSTIPGSAKQAIGSGYVQQGSAPDQNSYWNDYFSKLLAQQPTG